MKILTSFLLLSWLTVSHAQTLDLPEVATKNPGQFINLAVPIPEQIQVYLICDDPDLEYSTHQIDGVLYFYTAMPRSNIRLTVLSQQVLNGKIKTAKSNLTIKVSTLIPVPVPVPVPEPEPEPEPSIYQTQIEKIVAYEGFESTRSKLAAIFRKHSKTKAVQDMIDLTFADVQKLLSDDEKLIFKEFFVWLETYLREQKIPLADHKKWQQTWEEISGAFDV
jgi:hypothetical protein